MKGKTKILLVVIAVVTLIFSMNIVNAAEATKEANGWKYEASSEMVRIVGVTNKAVTTLTVPEKMEGVQGPLVNLSAFEGLTSLKEIRFEGKMDEKSGNNTTWVTTVDQSELSETTKAYFAKNVTVYGYSYDEVEDKADNAMLSPKGFASRYGMKFVDLAKEKTAEEVMELIPNEIKLNIKETEFMGEDGNSVVEDLAQTQMEELLKKNGIDLTKFYLVCGLEFDDVHSLYVSVSRKGVNGGAEKYVKVVYSNSANYNASDAKMIQDYVKNLNLEDRTSTFEMGNAQSLYPLTIEAKAKKIEQELGIKVIINTQKGDMMDEEYYSNGYVHFAKNDIVYASKHYYILVEGKEGVAETSQIASNVFVDTTNSKKAVITANEIDASNNFYKEMVTKAAQKGYEIVFRAYELKLLKGNVANGVNVIFEVGTNNNGKQAIVLHRKADGTYEEFEKVVEDGKVEITVNEFSPFLVAIKEVEESKTAKLDDEPKTGETSYVVLASVMIVVSLVGISLCKKKMGEA